MNNHEEVKPKIRIFILEDGKDQRELLVDILRMESYEVVFTDHIKEANEMLSQGRYDVYFFDILIPGRVNAFDFLKTEGKDLVPMNRVIFITAYEQLFNEARITYPDNYVFLKPVWTRKEILNAVQSLI